MKERICEVKKNIKALLKEEILKVIKESNRWRDLPVSLHSHKSRLDEPDSDCSNCYASQGEYRWTPIPESELSKKTYYWVSEGDYTGNLEYGKTHVPASKKILERFPEISDVFEKVRKDINPNAPSRNNCAYVCDSLEKGSYCAMYVDSPERTIYEVKLHNPQKIFEADGEWWTEAVFNSPTMTALGNWDAVRHYAETYWEGVIEDWGIKEVLVYPPESAIIVGKVK